MHPKERAQMMAYLTRSGIKKQVKFASDLARPDPKPIVKEIELFNAFNRRNPKADGGRIGFYKAGLVTRGPRKGEYAVDTDPTQYFKTEKKANKFIKDLKEGKFRKTAAGDKFLTGAEFKKLYKSIEGKTDREFADILNDQGFLTQKGEPFNAESVETRRSRLGIKSKSPIPVALTDKDILKQAKEMKLDIKGKSIDEIRRSVLGTRFLEKGRTAEELKKLRDFRERKVLMAGKEREFPFNIGKKPDPKKVFWRDLLDNAQRHQAFLLKRPGPILPESHIKFQNINQVRPTDVKSVFDIKLIDSNVIDPKTGKPKVLTYDNFLKHIDDNQRLYRIDSKTALQEYKKKRFIQENPDLRDKYNLKVNKAYDPKSKTSRAVFSPMHIHHTAGRGRNAFNVQFAVATENMQENALRRTLNRKFDNAKNFGEQRAAVKEYLNKVSPNLEVRLKNTPYGQRETLIDMTKRVAPELEQQVRAAGGAELGFIDRQLLADVGKFAGKSFRTLGTRAAGSLLAADQVRRNIQSGENIADAVVDPLVGLELAFPGLFKENIAKITTNPTAQRILNLGRFARLTTPVGLGITAAGLGIDAAKAAKKRLDFLDTLTPDQKKELFRKERQEAVMQNLRGGRNAFDEFAAAGGGIAKQAGDSSGRPPERGPNPQGLPSLLKRGRNL